MLRFIGFLALLAAATASTPELRAQERLAMRSDTEPKVFGVRMVDKSPIEFDEGHGHGELHHATFHLDVGEAH